MPTPSDQLAAVLLSRTNRLQQHAPELLAAATHFLTEYYQAIDRPAGREISNAAYDLGRVIAKIAEGATTRGEVDEARLRT